MITFLIISIISFAFLLCVFNKNTYFTNAFFSSIIACFLTATINVVYFSHNYNKIGEYTINKSYKINKCDILSKSSVITTDNDYTYSQQDLINNASYVLSNDSLSYIDVYTTYYGKKEHTDYWLVYFAFPVKQKTYLIKLNEKDYAYLKPFINETNVLHKTDKNEVY